MKIIQRNTHTQIITHDWTLNDALCKRIAQFNGSSPEQIREWLEAGKTVHTNFSTYEPANEPTKAMPARAADDGYDHPDDSPDWGFEDEQGE